MLQNEKEHFQSLFPGYQRTAFYICTLVAIGGVRPFLAACVYSFNIKTALIPTGKKFRIGVRTPKLYYEARGELPRYRRHLIWVYWFFFGFGVVLLLVDLLNIL